MGQAANSNRNASLDNMKERAAGRGGRTGERSSIRKVVEDSPTKGATGGAFGADGKANRTAASRSKRPAGKRKG